MARIVGFRGTKLYDLLTAAPLLLLYGLGVATNLIPDFVRDCAHLAAFGDWAHLLRDVADIAYFSLILLLVLFRSPPLARSRGFLPRAVALAALTLAMGRAKLPHEQLPAWLDIATSALVAIGTGLSIVVLARLGRAFTILPEARRLVTDGPYGIVRHPLYVSEEISSLGVMLQFAQPWSILIEIASVAAQLWRITFEERVLTETFPEYTEYAARTWRLIPGVY